MSSCKSIASLIAQAIAIVCLPASSSAAPKAHQDSGVFAKRYHPSQIIFGEVTKFQMAQRSSREVPQDPAPASDRPSESVKPVFERAIPNLPDRKMIAVVVSYPPGARSRPHRHAGSAFIYAYVLSGAIRSAVGAEHERVYGPGESFYEGRGAHHSISENASNTEPASMLAVFIVKADDKPLTVPDAEGGK
ncbi:cupin domain-containing protein [Bradyrhizobium liaoningense]|uniref:cupin domain-containing protein n=1 Tax=Bradyrhizobium liaoningense TaxID=43992 RepID=UPI0028993C93|nr:cupin domain-containing protein [Bradyrhizobium liaoningense]